MPCYDPRSDNAETVNEQRERIAFLEAALCATLRALDATAAKQKDLVKIIGPDDDGVVNYPLIDYERAGISKEALREWWNAHRKRDNKGN